MERYELVEGSASKFWEAAVEGTTLTVRFGRIGTPGQTKEKSFASAEAAAKEKDKLVKEKTGKGYAPAGSAPAPAKPAPAKTATIKTAKAETAEIEPADRALAVAAKAPPESKPAPPPPVAQDGVLFSGEPLPTRTRHPPPPDAAASWAEYRRLLLLVLPHVEGELEERDVEAKAWLEARLPDAPPAPVEAPEAIAWFNNLTLVCDAARPNQWRAKSPQQAVNRACFRALAQWLVASAGAVTAAVTANGLRPETTTKKRSSYNDSSWSEPLDLALRAALVAAPEPDYENAVSVFAQICEAEPDWRLRAYFAFLLADDRPDRHGLQALAVLEEAEAGGVDVQEVPFLPLVVDAPPVSVARWRIKRTYHFYMSYCEIDPAEAAATLVAVARACGEPAAPALEWLLYYANDDERTLVAKAILQTDEDGALPALLPVLHEKWIRAALDEAAQVRPAATFRQCLAALASGRAEPAIKARVMETIERNGAGTVRAWTAACEAKAVNHLERLLAGLDVPMADKAAWPAVLADPPWRRKARAREDIVLALAPIATPFAYAPSPDPQHRRYYWRDQRARVLAEVSELAGFIAEVEAEPKRSWPKLPDASHALPLADAPDDVVIAWLEVRLREIHAAVSYGIRYCGYERIYDGLERQPEALSLALWELTGPLLNASIPWGDGIPDMLARFGEWALPGLVKLVESDPVAILPHAHPVDAGALAPLAARALLRLKKARAPAIDWLRAHRRTAMVRLVPDAVGKPGPARDAAEHGLRWFVTQREDGRSEIDAIVADYARAEPRAGEAMAQVLERDPLARVPAKVAKPPAWFVPSALTRPVLKEGGALPDEALVALVEMLSFASPDDVYAGIPMVRAACTPASIAGFAFDLFSAWLAAGAPSKEGFAMRAVGWLGDDECARGLTRLIRKWPGEAAHARAVTGLDVLVDIGSDVALMNLNGIAEKLKFKGLQEKAREKIAALAEARDLTPEELSDRLAPDLDLDERGGLDLDFGARRFRVGFDEFLKPWVKDASGQRLKDLPKPNKADDPESSPAAVARWSALRKDARAIASLQLARLEAMLSTSRRVKPDVFHGFFATHPLIRHLAQRLVWGIYGDADPRTAPHSLFRVADDLSFTDAQDETLDLDLSGASPGLVGLVHPLHVPEGGLDPWGALFGDYEIAQPFPQLGRETYGLTDAEKGASELDRFEGIKVESKRLRGMGARGWPLGDPQDGGAISWIERAVVFMDGKTGLASLTFSDGLHVGAPDFEDASQTLGKLTLGDPWFSRSTQVRRFGDLAPVTASEMLRGPSLLVETRVG